jgi:hypothetical protein
LIDRLSRCGVGDDELLAAVDFVCRAGERRVGRDVFGHDQAIISPSILEAIFAPIPMGQA